MDEDLQQFAWKMYIDGSFNPFGGVVGLTFISSDKEKIKYALPFGFKASNNEAKYKALVAGLKLVEAFRVRLSQAYNDS